MSIMKQLNSVGIGTFLLLASILPSLVVANIDQLPMIIGLDSFESPLKGWSWLRPHFGNEYEYGISDDLNYHGHKCIYIRSLPANPPTTPPFPYPFTAMATLSQIFKADQYRGKRMKFSGVIKSEAPEGSMALTMRVDGLCQGMLEFDDMYGRNITGITDWKKVDAVLDVPWEGSYIQIGITMAGTGQIWASGLMFEETTDESTGKKMYEDGPKNLDFSG
jgi:hypothetical protein